MSQPWAAQKFQWVKMSHCDKPSLFRGILEWTDNLSILGQNYNSKTSQGQSIAVVKCYRVEMLQ
jgi:hypothetical protein